MLLKNAINNIPSLQAGNTASITMPIGQRLHELSLFLSSSGVRTPITSTNVTRIRVTIGAYTLIDWDVNSFLLYAQRIGRSVAVGEIPIFFTDPTSRALPNAYAGSIDTKQGITSVTVYVTLGTITAPTMTGILTFDNFPNEKTVWVAGKKTQVAFNTPILKTTQNENIPTSANATITDIAADYPLSCLTLTNGADANISYLRLSLDSQLVYEGAPADIARMILTRGIYTPPGTVVLPFTEDGFMPGSAPSFSQLTLTMNSSATFASNVIIEKQLPSLPRNAAGS